MRIKNSMKNIIFGLGGQIFTTLLSFISRTIFIYVLGGEYLGVNGLFSNILSMLSLAELGVGSAIIYNMYKPLAEKNKEQLKSLMKLYKNAYTLIGITIALIGLAITPFLNFIIKDKPDIPYLTVIYLLFLLNSVVSYFFIYKSSLIIADQKNYIVTIQRQKFMLIQTILQIIILLTTKNYIIYLLIQIICSFLLNLSLSKRADKIYPFLKERNVRSLNKNNKNEIFKHVAAMMSHKVGGVVVNGTDNILISSFIGVFWVGLYSNYVMITQIINKFLGEIFNALTASIGNLNAENNREKSFNIYKKILFINFWLYGLSTICLLILFNPFIKLWIGEKFLLDQSVVLIIVLNFYLMGMRQTTMTFNTTLGLFWNDRYKPWAEAIINIIVSIFLMKKIGAIGVLLGTTVSTITTSFWVDPYILFKYGFKRKLAIYFKDYARYSIITLMAGIISYYSVGLIEGNNLVSLLLKGLIVVLIINSVFFLCCFKSDEFKYIKELVMENIRKH